MNPEWFPETALLIAGLFAGGAALRFLVTRQRGRAVRLGAASLALIALALALASSETLHPYIRRWREAHKPVVLLPVTPRDAAGQDSEATPSTSLLLGSVLVRVAPSNRYVLAVDGRRFLTLDVDSSRLIVGYETVGPAPVVSGLRGGDRASDWMNRYVVPPPPADSQPDRSDRHTLIAREHGEVVLRIHYAEPHKIEVTGRFYPSPSDPPILISPTKGIHWSGGGVPPGATLDLRPQGQGTIDFERTGLIRILPR